MKQVKELIQKHLPKAKEHRYWLHENPEPSHQEKETARYLADTLRSMGLTVIENIGGYGLTAVIEGGKAQIVVNSSNIRKFAESRS